MRICVMNITSGNMCWGYRNYLAHLIPRLVANPEVEGLVVGIPQTIDGQSRSGGTRRWDTADH